MTDHEKDRLRRRMEEVAALQADDPRHEEVFRQISQSGPWAEQYWLELLRDDEKLRLLLRHVHPSEDLRERLLKIPATTALPRMKVRRALVSAGVAVICLIVAVWVILPAMRTGPTLAEATRELAVLAAIDHVKRSELTVETAIPSEIVARFKAAAKFPVSIPVLGEEYNLLGGRVCKFGTRPIIYTRWRRRGREYSLCQVRPTDFDLPREFPTQVVSVPAQPKEHAGYRVVIWSEGHCAFVLVCDDPAGGEELSAPQRGAT